MRIDNYRCPCGKTFRYKAGFCRHQQVCAQAAGGPVQVRVDPPQPLPTPVPPPAPRGPDLSTEINYCPCCGWHLAPLWAALRLTHSLKESSHGQG